MSNDQDAVADGLMSVIGSEFWGLGNRLHTFGNDYLRHEERPDAWFRTLLGTLNCLAYDINVLRGILLVAANEAGHDRQTLAEWSGVPADELHALMETQWVVGSAAAALGTEPPSCTLDAQEGHRDQRVVAENPKLNKAVAKALTELLALHYTSNYDADLKPWLSERIRRCIRKGWYANPKAAPGQPKTEPEQPQGRQLEAVPESA